MYQRSLSKFLYHTACPKCGSRDNVAVYDDGHGWCFGCRRIVIEPETSGKYRVRPKREEAASAAQLSGASTTITLPPDYTLDIPERGLAWLQESTVSPAEIRLNRIGWSQNGWKLRNNTLDYSPLLILPVYDDFSNLLMYQARYFGSLKLPKYWTVGDKTKVLHILQSRNTEFPTTITVVEDVLSAIKVSRIVTALTIFGSDISTELAVQLHNRYSHLIIWLDPDKRRYARARALSLRYLFDSVRVIESEADPKVYSTEEIRRFISGQ